MPGLFGGGGDAGHHLVKTFNQYLGAIDICASNVFVKQVGRTLLVKSFFFLNQEGVLSKLKGSNVVVVAL